MLSNLLKIDYALPWIDIVSNFLIILLSVGTLFNLNWTFVLLTGILVLINLYLPKVMQKRLLKLVHKWLKIMVTFLLWLENGLAAWMNCDDTILFQYLIGNWQSMVNSWKNQRFIRLKQEHFQIQLMALATRLVSFQLFSWQVFCSF